MTPPPCPTWNLSLLTRQEIGALLQKITNHSTLGLSGHTWAVLKWTWEVDEDQVAALLEGCIQAGYHPNRWKEAIVCIIPKPNQADYTLPKNFHPISLLECLGKLLKKIIKKIIYRDIAKHALVPTNQFGGHNSSSMLDAGLMLLHDIQLAQ